MAIGNRPQLQILTKDSVNTIILRSVAQSYQSEWNTFWNDGFSKRDMCPDVAESLFG